MWSQFESSSHRLVVFEFIRFLISFDVPAVLEINNIQLYWSVWTLFPSLLTFWTLGSLHYYFRLVINLFFVQNYPFFKLFSFQECHKSQTVWIQIRPDILSGLVWIQTVCKGYQQTTKIATGWWSVNGIFISFKYHCLSWTFAPLKSQIGHFQSL